MKKAEYGLINNQQNEKRFDMARYVDGFVVPVPKKNVEAYGLMARKGWREHRDSVNAKMMSDPCVARMRNTKAMPFNGKRMFIGDFKAVVEF